MKTMEAMLEMRVFCSVGKKKWKQRNLESLYLMLVQF